MNPSKPALWDKIDALAPARFQALIEEYVPLQYPGRFKNLQRRGSNPKGETIAGWPDAYEVMSDGRLDILEVTHTEKWDRHLPEDVEKANRLAGRISGFVFVAWARTPDPTVLLKFQSKLVALGTPSDRIAFVFQEQLVSDLCQAKFALLWKKYLDLPTNCLPFHPIEQANIYGSVGQPNIFTPTKEEYSEGLVHHSDLASQVEHLLSSRGWALVRGKGASGKTVMGTQIALGPEFRGATVYYLNLADLVSANESDSSRVIDVITWRKDQRVLFIIDNVHLDEQLAREVFDYWRAASAGSRLLLMGRWMQSGPGPRGLAAPLADLDREALRLEVAGADLLGVLHRLAVRLRVENQIGVPPADVIARWLALFGGDLIAFSGALARRIPRIVLGDWQLTADDAKEYVRSAYLYPVDNRLTDDERRNLLLIAALSKLELATPYEAVKRGDIGISLRTGLVHRTEHGLDKHVRFALIHPGFGELLLSAADPLIEEKILYQELAMTAPADASVLVNRLQALGQQDAVLVVLRLLAADPRKLVKSLLWGGVFNWTKVNCARFDQLGIHSFKESDEDLCQNPDALTTAAVSTNIGPLLHFLHFSKRSLPKSYAVVVGALGSPDNLTRLAGNSLSCSLSDLTQFLNYAERKLPKAYETIASNLNRPNNLVKLVETALHADPGDLVHFLNYTERTLPKVYKTVASSLNQPDNLVKFGETALHADLGHLVKFLNYTERKLPKVYETITSTLSQSDNLGTIAQTALLTSLDSLVSFFRFSMSKSELRDMPVKVLVRIDQPTWDSLRLSNFPDRPDCMHSAATLFQRLGRVELMEAPAQAAILRAETRIWHAPGVSIHHLGQTLRLGYAVDRGAIERFLRVIVGESWLKDQYEAATSGAIAACIFGVWAHHDAGIVSCFVTDALHARLGLEVRRLACLEAAELSGAIQLVGCCILAGVGLRPHTKWPTLDQIVEVLRFAAPKSDSAEVGHVQVQLWLGLREVTRLCPDEIRIPSEVGELVLALWRKADPKLERHLLLNKVMIPWLNRCSQSGWLLVREQNTLLEELARQAPILAPQT